MTTIKKDKSHIVVKTEDSSLIEEITTLFNSYDPYTRYIDDYSQMLEAEERNNLIIAKIETLSKIDFSQSNLLG